MDKALSGRFTAGLVHQGFEKATEVHGSEYQIRASFLEYIRDLGMYFMASWTLRHTSIQCPMRKSIFQSL